MSAVSPFDNIDFLCRAFPFGLAQAEPWPPMPTAPNLREIVDKYRPPMPRQGMSRSGSLASQPSAGSAMVAASGSTGVASNQQR